MKAMVVRAAKQPLVPEERDVPEPGRGEVRIRVHACGVCHSDHFVTDGLWPGLQLPRVPGARGGGRDRRGGRGRRPASQRATASASAGTAATTARVEPACAASSSSAARARITGITFDGGYAEY